MLPAKKPPPPPPQLGMLPASGLEWSRAERGARRIGPAAAASLELMGAHWRHPAAKKHMTASRSKLQTHLDAHGHTTAAHVLSRKARFLDWRNELATNTAATTCGGRAFVALLIVPKTALVLNLYLQHNPSMASHFPPNLTRSDGRLKGHYFQIPPVQQELLRRDDAWSDSLKSGPHGLLNVPDRVLQDVKDFHLRKQGNSVPPRASSDAAKAPTLGLDAAVAGSSKPPEPALSSPLANHHDADDSDGTPVEGWHDEPSQTGEADGASQDRGVEQDLATTTVPLSSPRHRLKSQNPAPEAESTSYIALPPSSVANSDDLEIEAPGFLSQEFGVPVNRGALQTTVSPRLEPTPPSAQVPVPSKSRAAPMAEDHKTHGIPHIAREILPRNAATTILDQDTQQMSSTTANSSMLPSGQQSLPRKNSESGPPPVSANPAESNTKSSNLPATWEGRPHQSTSQQMRNTGLSAPAFGIAPTNAQPVQRDELYLTPYERFKTAYPDYPETCRKFVSGCLNVKQIMRDRTLPEFLYDDFIRAFSTDFMLYISECNRKKARRILPAVEWYNEAIKDPEYMKKVVRKDNLAAILQDHASDVRAIRRALGDSQSTASDSTDEESDEKMADALIGGGQDDHEMDVPVSEDARRSQPSPEIHTSTPRAISSKNAVEHPHRGSGTGRKKYSEAANKPTRSNNAAHPSKTAENSPTQTCESQTVASSKQAARHLTSSTSHLKSPKQGQLSGTRSSAGGAEPVIHKTPATQRSLHKFERIVHSSGGSIDTISPTQRLPLQPSSSRPIQEPVGESTDRNVQRQDEVPTASSPPKTKKIPSNKRPLASVDDEADDEDDEDAFDPPFNGPFPPPKRPAHNRPEDVAKTPPVTSTPIAKRTVPSTMPTAARPAGIGSSPSRPSSTSVLPASEGSRDHTVSLMERSYSKKRLSEAPAVRSKNFREFLKKRKSMGAMPSSTPAVKR